MTGRLRGRQTQFYIDVVYGAAFALGFGYLLFYGMDARVAAFQGGLVLGYFLRVWENMSVYERLLEEEIAAEAEARVEEEVREQVPAEAEDRVAEELDEQVRDEVEAELDEQVADEVAAELDEQMADEVADEVANQLGYIDEDLADDVREQLERTS